MSTHTSQKGARAANSYRTAFELASGKKPQLGRALVHLQVAEQAGHAEATYALGTWYLFGRFVIQDLRRGLELLNLAVRRGSADAAFDLGICFENGVPGSQNLVKAFENYLTAAIRYKISSKNAHMYSFSEAAWEVARCYREGVGVVADRRAARIWRQEARAFRSSAANKKLLKIVSKKR